MAKTITINISDADEKLLYNDINSEVVRDGVTNEGIKDWVERAVEGKINNVWKRFHATWSTKLTNDSSFTDPIPSNKNDFVDLVTARSDYQDRKTRDDQNKPK